MTLSRIIFTTIIFFISTNANAQLQLDMNAMENLLGDAVQQLQKKLDDMNTEQTTETNSQEDKNSLTNAESEEKRKQEEAKKQAEENAKIDEEAESSIASFVDAFKMKLQVEKTIQKAETAFQEADKVANDTEKWLSR